jgi:hypothetical protein
MVTRLPWCLAAGYGAVALLRYASAPPTSAPAPGFRPAARRSDDGPHHGRRAPPGPTDPLRPGVASGWSSRSWSPAEPTKHAQHPDSARPQAGRLSTDLADEPAPAFLRGTVAP